MRRLLENLKLAVSEVVDLVIERNENVDSPLDILKIVIILLILKHEERWMGYWPLATRQPDQ